MNIQNNHKKETLKAMLRDYLEEAHGINTRQPFCCLNPEHEDRHPSMAFDKDHNRCVCFACGARYDIFDVIGIDYGLTSYVQQFRKACQLIEKGGADRG